MTDQACPVCHTSARSLERCLGNYTLYQCSNCSLVFAPDSFSVEVNYTEIYDSQEYFDEQVSSIGLQSPDIYGMIPTYKPFFENVQATRGKRLLDVGCGVGRFCQAAHARGWDVTGIDVSENAIQIGKRYAEFPLISSNIDAQVIAGEQYDIVTAFEVLEHLSDPISFIKKCQDASTPNGEFFFTVPNWASNEAQSATRPDLIPPVHVLYFTLPSLKHAMLEAGLNIKGYGLICSDPYPGHHRLRPLLKWLKRRLKGKPNPALGLWIHASR